MKLYEVINGYCLDIDARAYCVANNEQHAFELATKRFLEEFDLRGAIFKEDFYKNLSIVLLCEDVSSGFCTKVYD